MALNWLMRDYLSQLVTRYQQWLDVEDTWPAAWRDATSLDDDLLELTADQQVPLAHYAEAINALRLRLSGRVLLYLAPPGVDEARLDGPGDQTNGLIRQYASVASRAFERHGGVAVDTADALALVPVNVT